MTDPVLPQTEGRSERAILEDVVGRIDAYADKMERECSDERCIHAQGMRLIQWMLERDLETIDDGGPAGGPTGETAPQATSPSGAAGNGFESRTVDPPWPRFRLWGHRKAQR